MELKEKKLTDEVIVKALEYCMNDVCGCVEGCPLLSERDCIEIMSKNALDLIHRLQENNGNQVCMRCDMQRKFDDLQTLCTEQKAEIERLTEELKNCGEELIDSYREQEELQDRNAELQKQVDELTDKLGKVLSGIKMDELLVAKGIEQAVKDTAKEIYDWLKEHTFECGFAIIKTYFRERYGVEVE